MAGQRWSNRVHGAGTWVSLAAAVVAGLTLIGGVSPAAHAGELSPGCQKLNDPKYDGYYIQQDGVSDEFYPWERVTITAGPPDSSDEGTPPIEEFQFALRQTPTSHWTSISVEYPGTIHYVLGSNGAPPVAVTWSTFSPVSYAKASTPIKKLSTAR